MTLDKLQLLGMVATRLNGCDAQIARLVERGAEAVAPGARYSYM